MTPDDLTEQIGIEVEAIWRTIEELESLLRDCSTREPSTRDLAAAGLFLANFYGGVENILKRICRFKNVPIPSGSNSHVVLVRAFSEPRPDLPLLLDEQLAKDLAPYRNFRHVVHHGYGFRLTWNDMRPGVQDVGSVFAQCELAVNSYLEKEVRPLMD